MFVLTIPLQAYLDAKYYKPVKFKSRYKAYLIVCAWEMLFFLLGYFVGILEAIK